MTYNEFKMCCILFCKTFEGKKYGDIVKGCYYIDMNITVSLYPTIWNNCFIICDSEICCYRVYSTQIELYRENDKNFLSHATQENL